MAQKIVQKQKRKDCLMGEEIENQLRRINHTLSCRLAVRNAQHKIAMEGLRALADFGDISVATKTIDAILDCVPDNS